MSCTEDGVVEDGAKREWKPFLRQLVICSGVWTSFFTYGMCLGAPTVYIPQIRRENNSTSAIGNEMASWLSSASTLSAFPMVILISILSNLIGKKPCFIFAAVDILIAFVILYCSNSVVQLLISAIVQGLFCASQVIISIVVVTEYTSPKYRGIFLMIKCANLYWGIWVANAIGTFCHWKVIGIVGIVCALYKIITALLMWPESPYWLASKGRYEECAASHRWLKGFDEEAEKELQNLISTQTEYRKSCNKRRTLKEAPIELYRYVISSQFYKPISVSLLSTTLSVFSGKVVCAVYAIDIIKKITDSETTAYIGMLILDGITVLSMYVGCFIAKFFNRRPWLLVSSSITAFFLFLISLYLYLINLNVITENKYVSVCLLMLLSIAVSVGPMMMSSSVYVELIPIKFSNLSMCVVALISKFVLGIMLKISPLLFKTFELHGVFLFFGIVCSICVSGLYVYLPETSGKTLQEINDCMLGGKKKINEDEVEKLTKLYEKE